ncbi:MAG TPA: 2-amino-4-hydroxy-6-hydroxymethyldihydropteridine diphosphokinase [Burkholderiaceae bacterium]
MPVAYIGLGANLGEARAHVEWALAALAALPQSELTAQSSLYRTAPQDAGGDDYINAVAQLRTELSPHELLHALQALEQQRGRERPYRNAPRTLDLDLLLYGEDKIDTFDLTVPHPRLHLRAFALAPLAELDPHLCVHGQPVSALLAGVRDQAIEKI